MPDDILGNPIKDSEEKKPEEPKSDPVLETLNSLKTTVDSLTTRLDDFDTKITELKPQEEEPKEEEWQPKSWGDVPKKAEEIAQEVVERKFEETKEQEEQRKQQETTQQKQIDTFIDNQISELEKSGVISKVENINDENDKGRSARREVFGFAARVGTMDLKKASEVLEILHKSGYTYDPKANNFKGEFMRSETTPQGIYAPVSSPSRSTGGASNKPDYKEIHGNSMDTLIKKVMG